MERLVNKRVRLQNRLTHTTLIACSDKESVNYVKLDNTKPKPENSVWVIKGKNPDKSVRLESVYGKVLGLSTLNDLTIVQADKKAEKVHTWWRFEDVDQNGSFNCVQINYRRNADKEGIYLCPPLDHPRIRFRHMNLSRLTSRRIYHWDIKIVNTPPTTPTPTPTLTPTLTVIKDHSNSSIGDNHNPGQLVPSFYMNKPGGMPAGPVYDVNSGHNVNESGTQIVGGVIFQTTVTNRYIHRKIIKRDG